MGTLGKFVRRDRRWRGIAFRHLKESKRPHVVQLQTYMLLRNAASGLLLYVDRDGENATRQFHVRRDDDTVRRAARVISRTVAGPEPAPLPAGPRWREALAVRLLHVARRGLQEGAACTYPSTTRQVNPAGFARSVAEAESDSIIVRGEDHRARTNGAGAIPATKRQLEMLERLAGRVMLDAGELAELITVLPTLTKPAASAWIDRLRALPDRRTTNGADVLTKRLNNS